MCDFIVGAIIDRPGSTMSVSTLDCGEFIIAPVRADVGIRPYGFYLRSCDQVGLGILLLSVFTFCGILWKNHRKEERIWN